jgi:NADPH-dependent curcumin reductase
MLRMTISSQEQKMTQNHAWRLMKRPVGDIADDDLIYAAEAMPEPKDGEFVLRTIYLSLDPTNRIWMSDMEQYMPPVELGAIMRGGVVGRVTASKHPKFKVGDLVGGLGGWAEYVLSNGESMQPFPELPGVALSQIFGTLFLVGPTAYFGLLDICNPKPGETVVVSAAAGAVGSIVGQIAKIKGAHVVGIAGGPEKCKSVVNDFGFDACIDYKNENVGKQLDLLCPKGIDCNFENVGGEIMEAVMARMNNYGRMALCGMISGYNATTPTPGPRAWPLILMHRLRVQGFIVTDYVPRFAEAASDMVQWMMAGKLTTKQDVRPGLENAVSALRDLYTGANTGKLMVQVSAE